MATGMGVPDAGRFCAELNAHRRPVFMPAYTGDCCDLDRGANPGFKFDAVLDDAGRLRELRLELQRRHRNGKGVFHVRCHRRERGLGQVCSLNLGAFGGVIPLFTVACN